MIFLLVILLLFIFTQIYVNFLFIFALLQICIWVQKMLISLLNYVDLWRKLSLITHEHLYYIEFIQRIRYRPYWCLIREGWLKHLTWLNLLLSLLCNLIDNLISNWVLNLIAKMIFLILNILITVTTCNTLLIVLFLLLLLFLSQLLCLPSYTTTSYCSTYRFLIILLSTYHFILKPITIVF